MLNTKSFVCRRYLQSFWAQIVKLVQVYWLITWAIWHMGNEIGVTLEDDEVGIGIEMKEGKQALMLADFSVLQFCQ